MTVGDVLANVLGAAIGGSGVVGIAFYFIRQSIDKKITAAEAEAEKKKSINLRRAVLEEKLTHAYGRMFFWMHKAIVDQKHNGELEKAFVNLQNVENEKKDFDREIIAQYGGK